MIRRTMDAAFLNQVANHPEVRPIIGGEGVLDLAETMANPANVALVTKEGGFLYLSQGGGTYEVHSLFLPGRRGAVAAARASLRYMFTATDCMEVVTKVPTANLAAKGLTLACGFDHSFDGPEAAFYSLPFARWRARDREIAKAGHWFHEELEAAKAATGSPLPTHPDDEAHDRAVGAAILMARAGNPQKASATYNMWARLAGYQQIFLISTTPPIFDVIDAVVQIQPDALEVLSCR